MSSKQVLCEYQKDSKIKPEDIKKLLEWLKTQAHLPEMTEHEVIWFLQSCFYSNETAKTVIDTYFTMRTLWPEVSTERTPEKLKSSMDAVLLCFLPKKTPEGYSILFTDFIIPNPDAFNFLDQIKLFDMLVHSTLKNSGTMEGLRIVMNMEHIAFGHLTKISLVAMKKFLYYLQDGLPVRLKGIHYFNISPIVDKLMTLMKPFMKKELMDMVFMHEKVDGLTKFFPKDCLPRDFGGSADSITVLHENYKKEIFANKDFYKEQEKQLVNEMKRPGKPKSASEIFGVDGTFKKLDLD